MDRHALPNLKSELNHTVVGQRKLRILCFHGRGANSNIMAFQAGSLKQLLGDDVEWDFLSGDQLMDDEDVEHLQQQLNPGQNTFLSLQLLSGTMPFYSWFTFDPSRPHVRRGLWENVSRAIAYMHKNGPFDAVLGFSEGCGLINLVAAVLRDRGVRIPWRLSLFFNGHGSIDHGSKLLSTPLSIPSIMVFGQADPVYALKQLQIDSHEEPLILEHDEGHKFPSVMPRAAEIYKVIRTQLVAHTS